jgi:hypothetical protein
MEDNAQAKNFLIWRVSHMSRLPMASILNEQFRYNEDTNNHSDPIISYTWSKNVVSEGK